MSQLCTELSKRGSFNNSRPALHNKLYGLDDTFDMRYCAFLNLKTVLEKKKYECFSSLIDVMVGYLCSERHSNTVFTVSRSLRSTILSIGLSASDKDYLLDNGIEKCDNLETVQVIGVECTASSGFDLMVEIANSFIHKYVVYSSKYGNKYKQLVDLASDFPLQVIDEIMSYTDDTTMTTTIVLKRCECSDSTTLSALIHLLSESRYSGAHCRLHLVLATSSLCSFPLPDDSTARSLMQVTSYSIGGPQQMYDALMSFVYNFENIPLVFPKVLVEAMHIAFHEFNLCITSTVNRLIFILSLHFQLKRSLLCIYKHASIVAEVLKKSVNSSNCLAKLLEYLGADDVANTDILLSASLQEARFQCFEERVKVDRLLFTLFQMLRDKVTRSKSITLAPSDLLWSAVSNGRQSHLGVTSRVLHELIYAVQLYLPQLPYRRVVDLLVRIREMFGRINLKLLQEYDDSIVAAATQAAEAAAAAAAEALTVSASTKRNDSSLGGKNKASNSNSNNNTVTETKAPEASVKDFVESVIRDITSLLLILDKFKTEFLEQDCIAGVSKSETVALSLNGMKEKFVLDPSCLKTTKIDLQTASKGGGAAADLVLVNCIDLYEGILADVNTWLESLVRGIRRLSPVKPVDGVFHLTEQCMTTLQECTDDNLQSTFATALDTPYKFLRRKGLTLDCQILYDKFKELRTGQVVANEWIHDLMQFGDSWEDSAGVQARKKSRSEAGAKAVANSSSSSGAADADGPVYSATMRCRFAATLHDMEKSGMLKCRRTGKHGLVVISREMFAWMSDS